jgi:hypothetical protein
MSAVISSLVRGRTAMVSSVSLGSGNPVSFLE